MLAVCICVLVCKTENRERKIKKGFMYRNNNKSSGCFLLNSSKRPSIQFRNMICSQSFEAITLGSQAHAIHNDKHIQVHHTIITVQEIKVTILQKEP